MRKMRYIYIVLFIPDGMPSSVDGEWAGTLGVFEDEDEAKKMKHHVESNADDEYDWLGHFSNTNGCVSSDRGFGVIIEKAKLQPRFEAGV